MHLAFLRITNNNFSHILKNVLLESATERRRLKEGIFCPLVRFLHDCNSQCKGQESESGTSSVSPVGVADVQTLGLFSAAVPKPLVGSQLEIGSVGTWIGSCMGWLHCRQWLHQLCNSTGPHILSKIGPFQILMFYKVHVPFEQPLILRSFQQCGDIRRSQKQLQNLRHFSYSCHKSFRACLSHSSQKKPQVLECMWCKQLCKWACCCGVGAQHAWVILPHKHSHVCCCDCNLKRPRKRHIFSPKTRWQLQTPKDLTHPHMWGLKTWTL